jgi:hypothetical protein
MQTMKGDFRVENCFQIENKNFINTNHSPGMTVGPHLTSNENVSTNQERIHTGLSGHNYLVEFKQRKHNL